jgi:hypothetical protein
VHASARELVIPEPLGAESVDKAADRGLSRAHVTNRAHHSLILTQDRSRVKQQ